MADNSTTQSVSSVSPSERTSPDALANQQRVLREQGLLSSSGGEGGFSFLSLLNNLASPVDGDLSALDEPTENTAPVITLTAKAEKITVKKSQTTNKTASADTNAPITASKNTNPVEDSDNDGIDVKDYLRVDANNLTSQDLKILQNQNPLAAVPLQILNPIVAAAMSTSGIDAGYQSMAVSKGLADALETAYNTQKPIRVDLADHSALILRLGKDGRVSAEFLAANQAAQLYYSQNLQELKNRLEAKQLPYGDLVVRDQPQQQQQNSNNPRQENQDNA